MQVLRSARCCRLLVNSIRVPTPTHFAAAIPKRWASSSGNNTDSPFYALGINLGHQISDTASLLDTAEKEALIQGIHDVLHNKTSMQFTREHAQQLDELLKPRRQGQLNDVKQKEQQFMDQFIKDNKDAKVVKSGLIILEQSPGSGQAEAGSKSRVPVSVTAHYTGKLTNGSVFDSSRQRGEPTTFELNQVIRGWQEAIPHMSKGGQYTIVLGSELAYGDQGVPPVIPPGATLLFDMEIMELNY